MHPDKLISRIKAVLNGGIGHFEIQGLANEYSELVMKIRDRVDQCVALIRAGNDYAALQVAESFPPLLDTAAKLAFVESPEWLALCRARNVPWPPPLNQSDIDLVNNLYGRRIGESHPLYRDYRQAIRERDELHALAILSSIIRINPEDQNARHEFLRLAEKVRDTHLRRLEDLLDSGETQAALELAGTLESLHLPALANARSLERAGILRENVERKAAAEEALNAFQDALALREADDWENAIPLIGRCRSLEKHHQLQFPDDMRIPLTEMEAWADAKNEERIRIHAHGEAVRAAEQSLQAATATPPASFPAKQIEERLRLLNQVITNAETLAKAGIPPEPDTTLLDTARQQRADFLARRRRRTIAVNSAVFLFFAAIAAVAAAWFLQQRDIHRRDTAIVRMASIPSENRLLAAEKFEQELSSSWDSHPPFAEQHRKFQTWIADRRKRTDSTFQAADAIAKLPDTALTPASLKSQITVLEAYQKQALTLPEDMRTEAAKRLATADKRLNQFRERFTAAALPDINTRLEALETAYAAALGQPSSAARLKSAESILPDVTQLDAAAQPVRFLLPTELTQRWLRIRASVINARTRWACDVQADNALAGTQTVDEHYRVLREVAAAFSAPAPTTTANATATPNNTATTGQPFTSLVAAESAIRAPAQSVLAPTVFKLWRVAANTTPSAVPFLPAETLPGEAADAAKLTQNKTLEQLYRHTRRIFPESPGEPPAHILSVGTVRLERLAMGDGYELRQSLDLYKADGTTEPATYTFQQFGRIAARGTRLDNNVPAPESVFLKQFSRFYDASSGRIVEPLLGLLDRVRTTPSISPLLKAWLSQELWKLASSRPDEWGIHFSPSARAANAKLSSFSLGTLTANSWVDTTRWSDRLQALVNFYNTPQTPWQDEGIAWLRVFQRLSRPGFVKIGHVTSEKKLNLTSKRLPSGFLIGIAPDGKVIRVEASELVTSTAPENPLVLREPLPFAEHTPVLMLDITPAAAATAVHFPATAVPPTEGWDAFVFQAIPATAKPTGSADPAPPVPAETPETPASETPTPPSETAAPASVPAGEQVEVQQPPSPQE
jgi:hypothetical protein